MDNVLHYFILLPLLGLLLSNLPDKKQESLIFWNAFSVLVLQWAGLILFSIYWLANGAEPVFEKFVTYYKHGNAEFSFDLYFDKLTLVYGFMAGLIATLVALFSRYYMHRDPGYRRFFSNMLFFFTGINLIVFSGNFETLFLGWEVLGISSFLLIGFYRERYLPVKNSMKVMSLFRLSDVMLLIGMWLCHTAFHRNITFEEFAVPGALESELASHPLNLYLIPWAFLVVAAIKSGQFPFSSWLPRAMEGPTTSSAIFYGSLSVHIGLFLMLRISPLWVNNLAIQALVITMGVFTALVSSSIANVQPTVKTQIAYSSIAQIGIMFIEVALGLEVLALVHFAGNALLRSYQLLVSPSVLNYLIHDQYYHFEKPEDKISHGFMGSLRTSLYMLSIKEYNLDRFQFHVLWTPFKWLGRRVAFLTTKPGYALLAGAGGIGLAGLFLGANTWEGWHKFFAFSFALLAFLLVSSAFTERASARRAWLFLIVAHVFINLAISYNIAFDAFATAIYLSGVVIAGVTGWYVLSEVERRENTYDLGSFYGHIYEYPRLGLVFLLSALALVGFPITPTFIGLDVVLSQVHSNQVALLVVVALCFVFMEIAVLRLYARVFLGQHVKAYHSMAFKNS